MPVLLARHAGFCTGVKRALDIALKEYGKGVAVYTLGPLVHNEAVIDHLARHGITVVDTPAAAAGGRLLIRTHGVTPAVFRDAQEKGLTLIDATCPCVRRVQECAAAQAGKGVRLVVLGDPRHPEVEGIAGWAGGRVDIVTSAEELECLQIEPPAALIAQTTGDREGFARAKRVFLEKVPGGEVIDTLCPETGLRQQEARKLAEVVDAMVVIGSASSANTAALVGICSSLRPTCRVAGAGELTEQFLRNYKTIGVTAGASTPHWTIKEVVERMEQESKKPVVENEKAPGNENAAESESLLADEGVVERENSESAEESEIAAVSESPAENESPVENENPAENESPAENENAAEINNAVENPGEIEAENMDDNSNESASANAMENEGENADENLDESANANANENVSEEQEEFTYEGALQVVQVGEQVTGKAVRTTADEVFIDIGYKTEALLPLTEVYLQEGETLPERFTPGTEIEVTVIDVDDQEGKVVVSHKRLAKEKRWEELEQALENETIETGIVKQVVPAGMVVELGAGIEGFMPGSLVDIRYIPDFKHFMGETVQFNVIEYNREKDKVILSRKKLMEEESTRKKEEIFQSMEIGSVVTGVVRRLTDFGAFVDIGGLDGLVHISEIAWERVNHPQDVLKVGEEIEVKVLDIIPEKERISLSLRQTQPDPWTKAMQDLSDGQILKGKVTRLVNFGAFVELKPGVEGLVHISQIADYHVKHPSEVLSEGEEIDVKILEVKKGSKRISLSIREAGGITAHGNNLSNGNTDDGNVTLGDLFGGLFEQETAGAAAAEETEEGAAEGDAAAEPSPAEEDSEAVKDGE